MGNANVTQSGDGISSVEQAGTSVGSDADRLNFRSGATVTQDPSNPKRVNVDIASGGVASVANKTGAVSLDHKTDLANVGTNDHSAIDSFIASRAQANGIASLDGNAKIPTNQLPGLAINDTFTVASQAAMLALTAEVGDIAIRTDLSETYVLQASPASTLGNWVQLLHPASPVTSVASKVGAVTLDHTTDLASVGTNTHAQLDTFVASRGAASGLATLDGTTKLPIAQIPTGTTSSTVALGSDTRITGAEQTANKGVAGGYAALDGTTKLPTTQLPVHASTHLSGSTDPIQSASEAQQGLMSAGDWLAARLFMEGDRSGGDVTLSGAQVAMGDQYRDITLGGTVTPPSGFTVVALYFRSLNMNGNNIDVSSTHPSPPAAGVATTSATGSHMGVSLSAGGVAAAGVAANTLGNDGNQGADATSTYSGGGGGSGGSGGGGAATTSAASPAGGAHTAFAPQPDRVSRVIRDPYSLPSTQSNVSTGTLIGSCGGGGSNGSTGGGATTAGLGGVGGKGAGEAWLSGTSLTGTGVIKANGGDGGNATVGANGTANNGGGGGGGGGGGAAGGIIVIKVQTLGGGLTTQANGGNGGLGAAGGTGGTGAKAGGTGKRGGNGSAGRVVVITR